MRFKSQVGVLIDATRERFLIRLPEDQSSLVLALLPENLQPLPSGSLVELRGLSTTELNGKVGTIMDGGLRTSATSDVLRYMVRLANGFEKSVKGMNLKPRSRLWDLGKALSAGRKPTHLQWRDEHRCVFIDGSGQHRRFDLHLPLNFELQFSHGQEATAWPLLVYMHGAGGGTFFTHSKKSLKFTGMQYAARTFVVVTPRCEWTWKGSPSEWVIELIGAWRALEWIDYRRLYLTGCSMGGMGVWELAMQKPELFAAISPVAAHHKKEMTPLIAHRLRSLPIYAVHDSTDGTCPFPPEQELWQLLRDKGNRDVHELVTSGVDHCKIHEHAYCNTADLYHCFLQHTRG